MGRTAPLIAIPLAGVLFLTACTGPAAGERKPEDSPLAQYFSAIYGGDISEDEQLAEFEAQQAEIEGLVAACMAKEGFEYTPNLDNGSSISFGSDGQWDPDDREWVSQYGYGMLDWPGREEMEQGAGSEEYFDPNADYTGSLSETELTAYNEALWGPAPTEEELADETFTYDWESAGCYGAAQQEVYGGDPLQTDAHQPIMDALNDFYMNLGNSPEVADLDREWAACMADAGKSGFTSQYDAQESISQKLSAYYESLTEWVENDPAVKEIQEEEVALALIDLDCREKVDYRAKYTDVQWELEEQFIADHKVELDALKAAAEQGR